MHINAIRWEEATHWYALRVYYAVQGVRAIPRNRPCNWCGQPVERGIKHRRCAEQELHLTYERAW